MVIVLPSNQTPETKSPPAKRQTRPVVGSIAAVPQDTKKFLLRRAFGPGFGTGQVLVGIKPGEPLRILGAFLPKNLHLRRVLPVPWETKPLHITKAAINNGQVALLEIAASQAIPPKVRLLSVSGHPMTWFQDFNLERMPITMSEEHSALLSAFTGMVVKRVNQRGRIPLPHMFQQAAVRLAAEARRTEAWIARKTGTAERSRR